MGILEQNMSKKRFGGKETGEKQQNRLFLCYLKSLKNCLKFPHVLTTPINHRNIKNVP